MQHRWMDIRDDLPADDSAVYLGGAGGADLWFTSKHDVLICQYETSTTAYVSYYPAWAVYNDVTGLPLQGAYAPAHPDDEPVARRWEGSDIGPEDAHKPEEIARYLAIFAPYIFTETQRAKLLGLGLTRKDAE